MSLAPEAFRRHAFVHLAPDAWQQAQASPEDLETLRDWLVHDRPLIVRRPCLSPDGQEAFLGLALPGKRRLSFRLPITTVTSISPPPQWQGDKWKFDGWKLRTFGSYAWQELTGIAYVTDSSDIDLVLDLTSAEEWQRWLAQRNPLPAFPHVDLEIIFAEDAAINWREYLGPAEEILVKSNDRVWLERKADLAKLFPA